MPGDDDMVFPKTSSSVFISTNIDYVLRCLGVKQLILAGSLTDQCVESAVRDACDMNYLVTLGAHVSMALSYSPKPLSASVVDLHRCHSCWAVCSVRLLRHL